LFTCALLIREWGSLFLKEEIKKNRLYKEPALVCSYY